VLRGIVRKSWDEEVWKNPFHRIAAKRAAWKRSRGFDAPHQQSQAALANFTDIVFLPPPPYSSERYSDMALLKLDTHALDSSSRCLSEGIHKSFSRAEWVSRAPTAGYIVSRQMIEAVGLELDERSRCPVCDGLKHPLIRPDAGPSSPSRAARPECSKLESASLPFARESPHLQSAAFMSLCPKTRTSAARGNGGLQYGDHLAGLSRNIRRKVSSRALSRFPSCGPKSAPSKVLIFHGGLNVGACLDVHKLLPFPPFSPLSSRTKSLPDLPA